MVRFQVLMAVSLKMTVFWDVATSQKTVIFKRKLSHNMSKMCSQTSNPKNKDVYF
jgi:hypothetical protein